MVSIQSGNEILDQTDILRVSSNLNDIQKVPSKVIQVAVRAKANYDGIELQAERQLTVNLVNPCSDVTFEPKAINLSPDQFLSSDFYKLPVFLDSWSLKYGNKNSFSACTKIFSLQKNSYLELDEEDLVLKKQL